MATQIMNKQSIIESAQKEFELSCKKYKDVNSLYEGYLILVKQNQENNRWGENFLNGYLSCIQDLIIIKKQI